MTTILCPSQPLADSRSIEHTGALASSVHISIFKVKRTISRPGLLFILDDNLSQPSRKAMTVVVDYSLADMNGCLADEIFEFLPAAVGWYLLSSARLPDKEGTRLTYPLKKDDELLVGSSRSRP